MKLIDFVFPSLTLVLAIISFLPAVMSAMLFDAPGSTRNISPWLWFVAIWIWVFGLVMLTLINFAAAFGFFESLDYHWLISLFLTCLSVFLLFRFPLEM